jgi:3-isopropylmalate/(R)-2-methylmalate dehydratase large subunit
MAKPVREMEGVKVDQVYIGSCTNGRIEDLRIAAEVLKGKKIKDSVRGIVSPATPEIFDMALGEGIIKIFMDAGFCVTNPTCGACLGMSNGVLAEGEVCASTTNRNFYGRMGKGGMVHLMSPATAAASAIAGAITNSPLHKGGKN